MTKPTTKNNRKLHSVRLRNRRREERLHSNVPSDRQENSSISRRALGPSARDHLKIQKACLVEDARRGATKKRAVVADVLKKYAHALGTKYAENRKTNRKPQ